MMKVRYLLAPLGLTVLAATPAAAQAEDIGVVVAGRVGMVFDTQETVTIDGDTGGRTLDVTSGFALRAGYRLSNYWGVYIDGLTSSSGSLDGADRLRQASLRLEYVLHHATWWFAAADVGAGVFHLAYDTDTGTDTETKLAPSLGLRWAAELAPWLFLGPVTEVWIVDHASRQRNQVPERRGWRAWVGVSVMLEARFQ